MFYKSCRQMSLRGKTDKNKTPPNRHLKPFEGV
jgi:hypothetical protein